MPIPNNPNVCKVVMVFARDTRQTINTFHVESNATWDLSRMGAIASLFKVWWATYYAAAVPTNVALTLVQVRLLDPTNPLAVDLPVSPSVPGARTGTPEPGNVTLTVSWRTGLAGRAYRGRIYSAGISEFDVSLTDTATSTLLALLAAAAAQLISQLANNSTPLVVFHRPHTPPHPLDNLFTVVTSYVMENLIDSQRRRLPGRGR